MTIVLEIPAGGPDPELAAQAHEAALVAQVRLATIAECQRKLRDEADIVDALLAGASLATVIASAWRSGADLLEGLRT